MFQDGIPFQPFNRPGTLALRWFAIVWLGVALPSAQSQEPPAAAPLPRNLAPNEHADDQVAPVPDAAVQPTIDSSSEPCFRSGTTEDCNYCLELWQGYCQEPRCLHRGISPRHHLIGCWQFCCSRLAWWRCLSIPISLPRVHDTSQSVCRSELNRNSCASGLSNHHCEKCLDDSLTEPSAPAPAPEPQQPVAPPEPSAPVSTPANELPPDPSGEQSSTAGERSVVAANESPEPRLQVRRVSRRAEPGTLRLVQALQQAAH